MVLLFFAVFTFIRKFTQPLERPEIINQLGNDSAPFLQLAGQEAIAWKTLGLDSIATAKREQKPILLVLGVSWSRTARYYDKYVFTDDVVDRLLARDFICARVDLDERPDWVSTFLPFTRVRLKLDPNFQMFVLSPDGKLLKTLGAFGLNEQPTPDYFNQNLISVVSIYQQSQEAGPVAGSLSNSPGALQQGDVNLVGNEPATPLSAESVASGFQQAIQVESNGGFPAFQTQSQYPQAWKLITLMLGPEAAEKSIDPMIYSPTVDFLRGGFYRGASDLKWNLPHFDKSAEAEAELTCVLTRLSVLNHSPYEAFLAKSAANDLLTNFPGTDGFVRAAQIGNEDGAFNRSPSASSSPVQLRALFPQFSQRQWVWQNLNLIVDSNPLMVPYISSINTFNSSKTNLVSSLSKILADQKAPQYTRVESLSVNATVAARLIEASRLLGDQDMANRATSLFESLKTFISGDDVLHTVDASDYSQPVLADYLAYADAALEDFKNLGRVSSIESGFHILNRGLFLFGGQPLGVFNTGTSDPAHGVLVNATGPQLVDDFGESTTAKVIRLAGEYGRLLQNSADPAERAAAKKLLGICTTTIQLFSSISTSIGPSASGFLIDSAIEQDGRYVVAEGSNPILMANQLMALAPAFPVVPAAGPVWPSLQTAKAGYYLIVDDKATGPLSLQAAFSQLGTKLDLGS